MGHTRVISATVSWDTQGGDGACIDNSERQQPVCQAASSYSRLHEAALFLLTLDVSVSMASISGLTQSRLAWQPHVPAASQQYRPGTTWAQWPGSGSQAGDGVRHL